MRNRVLTAALLVSMAALILDSRCAAASAKGALILCGQVLVPSLFPLFVLSTMLVPRITGIRIPYLARTLGMPDGSEGLFLLGCTGGFPLGAVCIAQAAADGDLEKPAAERMLGLCSLCGPAFLFGVLPRVMAMEYVLALFFLQLETALLLAAFWPSPAPGAYEPAVEAVSLPAAVQRATGSILSVCGWVTLAGVAAGFLGRWLFPILPEGTSLLLTGLLELSNGIFSLPGDENALTFFLSSIFVCFGGISVLLQIGGAAGSAGLRIGQCIAQKVIHSILGAVFAAAYLHWGRWILFVIPVILFAKITLEIPGQMVYNNRRKEGI